MANLKYAFVLHEQSHIVGPIFSIAAFSSISSSLILPGPTELTVNLRAIIHRPIHSWQYCRRAKRKSSA